MTLRKSAAAQGASIVQYHADRGSFILYTYTHDFGPGVVNACFLIHRDKIRVYISRISLDNGMERFQLCDDGSILFDSARIDSLWTYFGAHPNAWDRLEYLSELTGSSNAINSELEPFVIYDLRSYCPIPSRN